MTCNANKKQISSDPYAQLFALKQQEKAIQQNPNNPTAYIEIIYRLHAMLCNDDYDGQIITHNYLATLLKHYFDLSSLLFSESTEYLFFIGKIMHREGWYFGQNTSELALEMQKKAVHKEPENSLYKWSYLSSLPAFHQNERQIIELTYLSYTSYELLEWLQTKGVAGETVLDDLETSYILYYEKEWWKGKNFMEKEKYNKTVILFRTKQHENIQPKNLIYHPQEYSFTTKPHLLESNFCITINRLNLTVDAHHCIAEINGIFSNPASWIKKELRHPLHTAGKLKIISNLRSGTCCRYNEDKQGNEETWPVYFNPETNWLCIGNPENNGAAIEFITNCIAVICHSNLKALWFKSEEMSSIRAR